MTATHLRTFSSSITPSCPPRRAFFLAQGSQRVVYTYSSPRLEEDLRHEATHALLRGAFGDLPLWLDEGLAEYFETDLAAGRTPSTSGSIISPRTCAGGWSPEPAAARVADGHPPDDPARLPRSVGLGPPAFKQLDARRKRFC